MPTLKFTDFTTNNTDNLVLKVTLGSKTKVFDYSGGAEKTFNKDSKTLKVQKKTFSGEWVTVFDGKLDKKSVSCEQGGKVTVI